ncbi:MAG: hypothetical protein AAGA67_09305, partial [Cyanobacteria bacterium P01_F01_bin.153]
MSIRRVSASDFNSLSSEISSALSASEDFTIIDISNAGTINFPDDIVVNNTSGRKKTIKLIANGTTFSGQGNNQIFQLFGSGAGLGDLAFIIEGGTLRDGFVTGGDADSEGGGGGGLGAGGAVYVGPGATLVTDGTAFDNNRVEGGEGADPTLTSGTDQQPGVGQFLSGPLPGDGNDGGVLNDGESPLAEGAAGQGGVLGATNSNVLGLEAVDGGDGGFGAGGGGGSGGALGSGLQPQKGGAGGDGGFGGGGGGNGSNSRGTTQTPPLPNGGSGGGGYGGDG